MKIAVLNGSPRKVNTTALVQAFREGAEAAGHEVKEYQVGKMKIAGCLGCEYCHTKGEGACIQKDDFEKILPAYLEADMIVFASPVYYFGWTAKMQAAVERVYCIGKPAKAKKAALITSAGSIIPEGINAQYKGYMAYAGMEDMGIFNVAGEDNQSEDTLAKIREFAKAL